MYCSECGEEIRRDSLACSRCGKPLTSSIHYASLWRRAAAAIIDGIVVWVMLFAVVLPIALWADRAGLPDGALGWLPIVVLIAVGWVYFAGMESARHQGTLGKILVGAIVTDLHGHRVSFRTASGRYYVKIASALFFGAGFLMAAFTKKKQALHDKAADTLVVKVQHPTPENRVIG